MQINFKSPKVIVLIVLIAAAVVALYFLLTKGLVQNNAAALSAPADFKVSVFAENLGSPGIIAFDPSGKPVVSNPDSGEVFLIENDNGAGDSKKVLLTGLKQPYGLAFYTDPKSKTSYLYVAETNQVERFVYDGAKSEIKDKKGENIAALPTGGLNPLRNILFGPNLRTSPALTGYLEKETMSAIKLYISVGSSCDSCAEDSWKKGVVLESDPDGNYTAQLSSGLRNPLFLAVQPEANKIWAADQGREESNIGVGEINLLKPDKSYRSPLCYGNKIKDENFQSPKTENKNIPKSCNETESPAIEIPADFTPYGLVFVPPTGGWPEEWRGNLLVVFNSSTNGTSKIVRYKIGADGKPTGPAEDFVIGWNGNGNPSVGSGQEIYGRPVDLKFGPDGALYVTDDIAGKIYKIEYAQ